jgi:signal transduction histidine kinase
VQRNFYENAVKYTPSSGTVRMTAVREADVVAIRITDDGVGIAPKHVKMVFERFRRVGGDPTMRGMGMGLSLSRSLVEAQGGQIEASSPGLGQGATFIVTLWTARGWAEAPDL